MEKFTAFGDWLTARKDISKSTFIGNMEIIDKTLKVKDFEKIKSVSILMRLIKEFKTTQAFLHRSKVEKTSILGSFARYIMFVEGKE